MAGTLDKLALELARVFEPLEDDLASDGVTSLLSELGLQLPDVSGEAQLVSALTSAVTAVQSLVPLVTALKTAIAANDTSAIVAATAKLIDAIGVLVSSIDVIATALKSLAIGGVSPADLVAFAAAFAEALLDYVLVRYLEDYHPALQSWLALLTIVERSAQNVGSTDPVHPPYTRRKIHWDQIATLFTKPQNLLQQGYGWGTNTLDATTLFERLQAVLQSISLPAALEVPLTPANAPPTLRIFWLAVTPRTDLTPTGLSLELTAGFSDGFTVSFPVIADNWAFSIALHGALDAGLGALITPPASIALTPPSGTLHGDVSFDLTGKGADSTHPILIFGSAGGARLQADQISLGAGLSFTWDAGSGHASGDAGVHGVVQHGKVVIPANSVDSFLSALLPADGITVNFDLGIAWTVATGLSFSGSAGIETTFALNLTLGPIGIQSIHVALSVASAGTLSLEASLTAQGSIGPISAAIDRIGALAVLSFKRGNLGPVDLSITFKPPTGLGINIDAGPITGGGFVQFDQPNGRYAGVLALSLYSIQIKAIGLLDTKLPGGESGYSFLIIISVEFTPIQLGFGFTLNGVGGLCGINRDFISDAIQAGLRQHSLDHILFPKDPVANAPAIISDLRTIFPAALDRYVFGPMLELGWGGGLNLVTAELGIILAVPSPVIIAILGQFNVNLPSPDAAIVELHLDVLGIIDFGKKLFSLDATLHDSRIVVFTIFGDMAMRLSWGENPSFALSVGGLNPHFQPPDGFPTLKRLTIALSASSEFKLSIQTYFAITSNSFQLGAKAELYLGVSAFNVYGWLGFDALFIFRPFSFVVDFTAGFALRSGTAVIIGISIAGELSGPKPWHATGEAHVTLLFFDIGVHVDITWGESQQVELPPTDAWPPLQQAIQNLQNWSGTVPNSLPSPVSVATPAADPTKIYVDPSGVLTLRERVLPLNQMLTKFGEAVPGPQNTFTVDQVQLGGQAVPFALISDLFAPAQFEEMSDQDKLSRPSFDAGIAGFSVGEGQLALGRQLGVDVEYEDIYVDDDAPPPPSNPKKFRPLLAQQLQWAMVNGAAKSTQHAAMLGKFAAAATATEWVQLADETYVVASTLDLSQRNDITQPVSKGDAYRALAKHLADNPGESGQLQVLPVWELAA